MNRKKLLTVWMVVVGLLFFSVDLCAEETAQVTYSSKEDIQNLVNHYKENEKRFEYHFELFEDKIDVLALEVYNDLQQYNTKETLMNHLDLLFKQYATIGQIFYAKSDRNITEYTAPSELSEELYELKLQGLYIQLKMRLLGHVHGAIYMERHHH